MIFWGWCRKRWFWLSFVWILAVICRPEYCSASLGDDTAAAIEEEIWQDLDLKSLDELAEDLLDRPVSVSDMIRQMMKDGKLGDGGDWSRIIKGALGSMAGVQKKNWTHILLMVMAASLLTGFTDVFQNRQISEISFYMIFVFFFVTLLKIFQGFSSQLETTLSASTQFMKALLPSYHIVLTASGGISTAAVACQMILLLVFIEEHILEKILLPGIHIYLLMALINQLTGEQMLSRFTELLQDVIQWALKTIVGVVLGIQLLQKMVAPSVDSFRQTLLGKTAGAIPGLGNLFSGVTEVVIGSAVLLRNCLGAAAIIILVLAAVPPVVRLGVNMGFYYLVSAVFQPVADKRIIGCLHTMGESMGMLLKLLVSLEILFLLTIAMLAGTLR
ncbi:MAG: stage III sporulation protein AE [Oliverpabstia sp.]